MRVLIYIEKYFPHYVGGGERLASCVARALKHAGYEVVVATLGDTVGSYEYEGVEVQVVGKPGASESGGHLDRLSILLKKRKIKVLHIVSAATTVDAVSLARALKIKIVLSAMEYSAHCLNRISIRGSGKLCSGRKNLSDCFRCSLEARPRRDRYLGQLGKYMPDWINGLLVRFSSFLLKRYSGTQLHWWKEIVRQDRERVEVVHSLSAFIAPTAHAMNKTEPQLEKSTIRAVIPYPSPFSPRPVARRTSIDHLVVGFTGRAMAIKGLDVLLAAVSKASTAAPVLTRIVTPKNSDWVDDRKRLKQQADSIANVEWLEGGVMTQKDLEQFHSDIDVLAVPSVWPEYVGFVTLEAIACGTPVLISDYKNQRELFGHIKGVEFVEPGNVNAWSSALVRMWKKKQTDSLSVNMEALLDIEGYGEKLSKLYSKL